MVSLNRNKTDYEFECTTGIDYKLVIQMFIENKIFSLIYSQLTNHGNLVPTDKGEYEIPEKFYNLIYSTGKETYTDIKKQLLADKISLRFGNIKKATLKKQSGGWMFKVTIEGEYDDVIV